jgi:hypothetical protein
LAWFRSWAYRPSLWGDDQQRQQDAVEGAECALRSSQPELTAAYAATVVALTQIIAVFNQQIPALEAQVGMFFSPPSRRQDPPEPAPAWPTTGRSRAR